MGHFVGAVLSLDDNVFGLEDFHYLLIQSLCMEYRVGPRTHVLFVFGLFYRILLRVHFFGDHAILFWI